MNFGPFLFKQTSLNYGRIVSRSFNKRTQKFDYKKIVKVNKQANRKPRLSLILKEDVENLGAAGQMVQVKRGYGRNDLIPNRLAVYATDENKEKYLVTSNEQAKSSTVADSKILPFIQNACLEIAVKAGMNAWEITQHHVAVECRKQLNIVVPAHCVEISDPICSYGDHIVGIIVNQNTTTQLKCSIVPKESKGSTGI